LLAKTLPTSSLIVDMDIVRPYASFATTSTYKLDANTKWMNPDSFQIIVAGQDNKFGKNSPNTAMSGTSLNNLLLKVFPNESNPNGSNNTIPEENDNLTNFTSGTLDNARQ